jgi:osmotically-inducible protein OsmY
VTTDLAVRVAVRNGVVYLRGAVSSLDDAESAEEVASRVPGVAEVVEELDVAGF